MSAEIVDCERSIVMSCRSSNFCHLDGFVVKLCDGQDLVMGNRFSNPAAAVAVVVIGDNGRRTLHDGAG